VTYLVLFARLLAVGVFAVSGITKVADRRGFARSVRDLRMVPRRWVGFTAGSVIVLEFVAVVLTAVTPIARVGLVLATALLLGFAGVALVVARRGVRVPCRCFGASTTPLGYPQAIRNLVLALITGTGTLSSVLGVGNNVPAAGMAITALVAAVGVALVVFFDDLVALFTDETAHSSP